MGPHYGSVEGENLPRPAGHTPPNASQNAIGLLGSQGTLLAHGQPVVHQDTGVHRLSSQETATGYWSGFWRLKGHCKPKCSFANSFASSIPNENWPFSFLVTPIQKSFVWISVLPALANAGVSDSEVNRSHGFRECRAEQHAEKHIWFGFWNWVKTGYQNWK